MLGNSMIIPCRQSSGFTGLLDTLEGCVMAFSLYLLTNTYNGRCVRIRRSSDDAEQNFYFINGFFDYASAETFVGAGNDGYVCNWGNQYSGGNEAIQSTSTNQPKIIENGSFLTDGIKFDGIDDYLNVVDYTAIQIINQPLSLYFTASSLSTTGFILSRNQSATGDLQYAVIHYLGDLLFRLEASTKATINYVGDSNVLFDWSSDVVKAIDNDNEVVGSSYSGTLTLRDFVQIGAKKDVVNYSSFQDMNIKTLLLFNTNQYNNYSLISGVC